METEEWALVVSISSFVGAIISAACALCSVGAARRQNYIAGQIAILNNAIEEKHFLIKILSEWETALDLLSERTRERVVDPQKNNLEITLHDGKIAVEDICYIVGKYEDKFDQATHDAIKRLQINIQKAENPEEIYHIVCKTEDGIIMFRVGSAINNKIKQIDKKIKALEQKIDSVCGQ